MKIFEITKIEIRIAHREQQYGNDHTVALAKQINCCRGTFMGPSAMKVNISLTDFCIFYTEKQTLGGWKSMVK